MDRFLIAGLGNPGAQYEKTRHNAGFDAADILADKFNVNFSKSKFDAVYGDGKIGGARVIVAKPQTYMNLSGNSVREICEFYKKFLKAGHFQALFPLILNTSREFLKYFAFSSKKVTFNSNNRKIIN